MKQEQLSIVSETGTHEFTIEVASTPRQKSLGLMFRTKLAPGYGMLFPYPQPQEITMWMRNTLIPLDMIFITDAGKIHRIEHRTEPMSERIIASEGQVQAVLEIGGGEAQRLGLAPGNIVRHPTFGTTKPAR